MDQQPVPSPRRPAAVGAQVFAQALIQCLTGVAEIEAVKQAE